MVEMVKCEICGKLRPKGTVCCGVSSKNEMYSDYNQLDEPDVTR
jgi:hypothetical protein